MKINNATFITSVANSKNYYKTDKPIIAVAGKSNVGKSSLINMLANQKKLAKTSVTPGRTRLINYFDFGEFVLADLPGYGFAKVSDSEKLKWSDLLEKYLAKETMLKHVFFLVDIRHDPTKDDVTMYNYLFKNHLPFTIVATKADKIGKSQVRNRLRAIASFLHVGESNLVAISSLQKMGKDAILDRIDKVLQAHRDSLVQVEEEQEDVEE